MQSLDMQNKLIYYLFRFLIQFDLILSFYPKNCQEFTNPAPKI